MEAALRCFARNGIHPTSMQDIFAEAGLSAGAVYRYFPTKELLVSAVVEHVLDLSRAAVDPHRVQSGNQMGIDALLERLLSVFADPGPGDQDDRYRLVLQIWAEAVRSPQVGHALRSSADGLRDMLSAQIAAGQAAGELRTDLEPTILARTLTALFEGYAFQRAIDPAIDTDAYVRTVRALLQSGLNRA